MTLPIAARRGAVVFKITLFFTALAVGVFAGAKYVGVPVQDLAYVALNESELLDKIPEDWRPGEPEWPTGDCANDVPSEFQAEQLREDLNQMRLEAATIRSHGDAGPIESIGSILKAARKARRKATLAYWARLSEIVIEVGQLHDSVELALSDKTASHVLDLRRRAFLYGKQAILAADRDDVDPLALEGGFRLVDWYARGAELYQRASEIWDGQVNDQPFETAEAALAQSQEQHRKQTDLVREKTIRLNEILSLRYAVDFLPLDF